MNAQFVLEQAEARRRWLETGRRGLGADETLEIETRSNLEILTGWLEKAFQYVNTYPALAKHLAWLREMENNLKICRSPQMADMTKECGDTLMGNYQARIREFEGEVRSLAAGPALLQTRLSPVIFSPEETAETPSLATKVDSQSAVTGQDKPTVATQVLTTPKAGAQPTSLDSYGIGKLIEGLFGGWTEYEKGQLQAQLISKQARGQPVYLSQQMQEEVQGKSTTPWLAIGAIAIGAVALLAVIMSNKE
jgi:hypothetical protein